jgi:glycosyltransferase involved in cell wall biosynthesis/SAM-dependent methyltransferase
MTTRLVVIHYPFFGGPHNQALRLDRPLRERGITTTVLLPGEPGNAASRLRSGGVETIEIPLGRLRAKADATFQMHYAARLAGDVHRIRALIRERGIDFVEIAGLVNVQAGIAARLEGIPIVWQLLDTRAPRWLRRVLMPLVLHLADSIMCTGQAVAAAHPGVTSLNGRLVSFFPPVDTGEFRPDAERRAAARSEIGIPPGAFLAGCVANLTPQKRLEHLISGAERVHLSEPDIRFAIFGRPMESHREYEHAIRDGACKADIPIVDPRDRVAHLLPALDVFLLTSGARSEGIPTAVLEAMAAGVPAVATDVGALVEAVDDGRTGIIVPPQDVDAMAAAVIELARNPDLLASMKERARETAARLFDVETCADAHMRAYEAALAHARAGNRGRRLLGVPDEAATPVAGIVVNAAACPACRGGLSWREADAWCEACGARYAIEGDIPVLVADESEQASAQAVWFDEDVDAAFEIERPLGEPALYGWLMQEKFARGVDGLPLRGSTALVVCGGSGMDAEFLAREGAAVVTSDISLGAAQRALERGRRHRFPLEVVVADLMRLPFADASIDVVYVHDGLHHLEKPLAGLREMARVARRAVCVSEPARAAATQLAVRLGVALEREEAGNVVARLTLDEVRDTLAACGFRAERASRYAMFYRHEPGLAMRVLSRPLLMPVARLGWRAANLGAARAGNKLAVQAVRGRAD